MVDLDERALGRDAAGMHRSPLTTIAALAALLSCLTTAVPAPVGAAPSSGDRKLAESKALEAKVYFKRGLFREAAEAFMEAYSLSLAPDMMFNAARAYQEAKLPERALALFETYMTLEGVTEEGKADARARIVALKPQSGSVAPQAPVKPEPPAPKVEPVAPAPAPTPAPPTPAPAAPAPAAMVPKPSQPVATVSAPAPADKLGWGLLIGGGVLLGLGGLSYGAAVDKANQANELPLANAEDAKTYNTSFDEAQNGRGVAVVLAVAGTGLAAWGAWRLWMRGPIKGSGEAKASLWIAPALPIGGSTAEAAGAIALGGRF